MPKTEQLSPRVLAARRNGALGGLARAAKLTVEQKKAIASKGGQATQLNHGSELKRYMGTLRKRVGRYSKPVEECLMGPRKKKAKG